MNIPSTIAILIIALFISFWTSKRNFKNWQELNDKDKMYTLRPFIVILAVIVILLMKYF